MSDVGAELQQPVLDAGSKHPCKESSANTGGQTARAPRLPPSSILLGRCAPRCARLPGTLLVVCCNELHVLINTSFRLITYFYWGVDHQTLEDLIRERIWGSP